MKIQRLKIVDQIIIISLIGVLIPSVISWVIINNISRHSIRQELAGSAQMLVKIIENNIRSAAENGGIENIKDDVFKNIEDIKYRRIYIIDTKGRLLASQNYDGADFQKCLKQLPQKPAENKITRFDEIKNQPRVYLKLKDLNLIIIAATSKELTDATITTAGIKIAAAFFAAAAAALFLTLLYGYYLYFNIRQLFRGIIAVSRGNYMRPITLKTNIFTPREIVFLSEQFNNMINKIDESYNELEKKNKELKQLDSYRSNLIDTVSHELRTPLTSIKGYTSRLLRTDIEIDAETKRKSLMIIKKQSERLSRMIEDLLTVPDIEGAGLNIKLEPVNLLNCIETAIYSVKNIESRSIENSVTNSFPLIYADKDRLEQILINIISNADKYAYENTPIKIYAEEKNGRAEICVSNNADYIEEKVLNTLFDKFIRLDDKSMRSQRGTGLGLYIVKGLAGAMGGEVFLRSSEDNIFTAGIILDIAGEIEGEA